jgi:hypothetical protein
MFSRIDSFYVDYLQVSMLSNNSDTGLDLLFYGEFIFCFISHIVVITKEKVDNFIPAPIEKGEVD